MESRLHEFLKRVVFNELEKDGYDLYFEPSDSPVNRVRWSSYRPDVFGVILNETELRLVVAECETNPRFGVIGKKVCRIGQWFMFQKLLDEKHDLRLLLAIPAGMLHKVNRSKIRRLWDIWVINCKGEVMLRLPRNGRTSAS